MAAAFTSSRLSYTKVHRDHSVMLALLDDQDFSMLPSYKIINDKYFICRVAFLCDGLAASSWESISLLLLSEGLTYEQGASTQNKSFVFWHFSLRVSLCLYPWASLLFYFHYFLFFPASLSCFFRFYSKIKMFLVFIRIFWCSIPVFCFSSLSLWSIFDEHKVIFCYLVQTKLSFTFILFCLERSM